MLSIRVEPLASLQDRDLLAWSWSGEGNTLTLQETVRNPLNFDIGVLSMEGDHARTPLLQEEDYNESHPEISPDGKWRAYASNESGDPEIYVRHFLM